MHTTMMAVLKILLFLVVCVTVVMGETMPMTLMLDNEEEILDWHNEQRSTVQPPATNMLRLVCSSRVHLHILHTYTPHTHIHITLTIFITLVR